VTEQAKTKILVILGPTASGKSDLAVTLAEKFDGEVISADSRQVYRGLDIGTGKITHAEMRGIPHHLLDVADPSEIFTVTKWKELAEKKIGEIRSRGKLPIICGGTGYYIRALTESTIFPDVGSDPEQQQRLENLTATDLFSKLKRLDPERALSMSTKSESSNKRRLARAIIIAHKLGNVPPITRLPNDSYDITKIGISIPDTKLKERIHARLVSRIKAGMIDEAKTLHEKGLSYERMDELGLEYRYLSQYIQVKISEADLIQILSTKIWQYAKRQKTWFKKERDITWYEQPINMKEVEEGLICNGFEPIDNNSKR